MLFQGMGWEYKVKIMLHCFRKKKCQQDFTPGIRDPEEENIYFLFNSDIVNLLSKTNGGET